MKKFLLLLTLLCTLFTAVKATEVEIGVDDATVTTASYIPINALWKYGWSQQIYTAEEIGMAGTINSITFWMYHTGSNPPSYDISVYMAGVTDEVFATTSSWVSLSASDLVFSGTTFANLPTSAANIAEFTITFDTPFAYDGSSNLLIAFANNTGSYISGMNARVFGSSSGPKMCLYKYQDTGAIDPTTPGVEGTLYGMRNVIKLDITPSGGGPTCAKPSVEVSAIGARQATISWDSQTSTTFTVEYQKSTDDDKNWTPALVETTDKSIVLNNLAANTSYNVRVLAYCGDEATDWTKKSFTTLCKTPFEENFDGTSLPKGWSQSLTLLSDVMAGGTLASGGAWYFGAGSNGDFFDNHARLNVYGTSCKSWLITPEIEVTADAQLTFSVALTKYSGTAVAIAPGQQTDDKFVVLVTADGGATWTILQQWDNAGSENVYDDIATTGEDVTIELGAGYIGQPVKIAFYGESTASGGDNNLHIDNIRLGAALNCQPPTNLREVEGTASKNSVQLAWDSDDATAWIVQYSKKSPNWESVIATDTLFTLTGLDEFSTYQIRVAALCDPDDEDTQTSFSNTISITTATGLPYAQGFCGTSTTFPATWKRYSALWGDVQNGDPLQEVTTGWSILTKANANNVFPDSARHMVLNIKDSTMSWVVSPAIAMEAGNQLTFDLALTKKSGANPTQVVSGEQDDDQFIVFVFANGQKIAKRTWSANSGLPFDEISYSDKGEQVKIDLSEYDGQIIQIAFYGESTASGGDNNLHISNVKIDSIPNCSPAASLVIADVEATTASAIWTYEETGVTWEYGYKANPAADFVPADADFEYTTTEKAVALTGLSQTTDYVFFVRQSCGADTKSDVKIEYFTTLQEAATLPYENNFETENGWLFINGNLTNKWVWDESLRANNTPNGSKALYISNDNIGTYAYTNNSATMVYAVKNFYFGETGMYSFSFDWKAYGYSTLHYLRAMLIPAATTDLTAGTTTPTGFSATALPAAWEAIALDGGSQLNLDSAWNHQLAEIEISTVGYYNVVFAWRNSNSTSGKNPPAAIDNIKIARITCPRPTGLEVSDVTAASANFSWVDPQDGYAWEYAYALANAAVPTEFTAIAENSILLEGLTESTSYVFYLRKDCGDGDKSDVTSIDFQTKQLPVAVGNSFSDDFENGNKWLFINGALENAWVYGEAAHNGEGTHALYISNDGGTTHAYTNNKVAVVFAKKSFNFENGSYTFQYDWLCNGESTYDYLRVALVPESVELTAGTSLPSGVSTTGLPTGWISLDGSAKKNLATTWQTFTSDQVVVAEGTYNVVLLWRDDTSGGTNPPAAIDNFSIAKIACAAPANLRADSVLVDSAMLVFEPQGTESAWVIRYKKSNATEWTDSITATNDTVWLENLESSSTYDVQIAAWCDPTDPTGISDYSATVTFATLCELYSIAEKGAYTEGFEAYEGASYNLNGVVPACWEAGTSGSIAPHVIKPSDTYAYIHEGTKALTFYGSGNCYAVLPEFADSLKFLQISFWAAMESATTGTLYLGYVDSLAEFHELTSYDRSVAKQMAYYETKLDTIPAEAIRLAFVWSSSSQWSCCIDDIKVMYIPNCVKPENVAVLESLTSTNSVVLTWEAQNNETAWSVQYKKSIDSTWTTVEALVDTFLLEGLESATVYDVQVAAKCNETEMSDYSNPISFVTECEALASFPYNENFDGMTGATGTNVLPLCWRHINTSTYSSNNYYPMVYASSTYANSGTNSLKFYSTAYSSSYDPQDIYAILPEMEGISALRIKFNARAYGITTSTSTIYDATFTIGVMTDPSDTATFVPVATQNPSTTTYQPYVVQFDNYEGTGKYIAIKMEAAEYDVVDYRGFYMDDIVIDSIPTCVEPEGTISIVEVGQDTAKISWAAQAEGVQLQYAYAVKGAEVAEEAFVNIDTNEVILRGLTPDTEYLFYLRRNCGNAVSASISAPFQTKQAPIDLGTGYADDFENGNHWTFINGTLTNAWAYGEAAHNGEGTHALYISNDGGATNAYTKNAAAVVYATKAFNFAKGMYTFQYDWLCNGESTYDYLRVALIPASVELTAGTALPSGLSATALPSAWNAISLDGSAKKNLVTTWQTFTSAEIAVEAGTYNVVLLWRDDTSGGTDAPAAVDNFSIVKTLCVGIDSLAVSNRMTTSATISWAADEEQDTWEVAYDTIASLRPDTLPTLATVTVKPHVLENLDPETTYHVYVRANCGDEHYSKWSHVSFATTSSCQTPDNVKADSITTTSALISWNTYGQTGFNLTYTDGTNSDTIYDVTCPYLLEGLTQSTAYRVKVQVACAAEAGTWSLQGAFKTAIGVPFEEKFNATSIPTDWKQYSGLLSDVLGGATLSSGSSWYFGAGSNGNFFDSHARVNIYGTSAKYWLATPAVFIEGDVQLTFDVALTKYSGTAVAVDPAQQQDDKFAVVISTDNGTTWTVLRQWDNAGSAYVYNNIATTGEQVAISLAAYSGQSIMVAFYGESTVSGGDNNLHIDNVLIDLVPSCLKPTNLNVSNIMGHKATLAWTAGEQAQTAWQIAIDTIAGFKPDTLSNLIDVTENPYTLTGLNPSTTYYVYVRANCGEQDGVSRWTEMASFTTTVACPAPKNLEAVLTPGDGSVATMKWQAGGEEAAWKLEYSLYADMSDSTVVSVENTTYELTGLNVGGTYYVRVQADCGELDGESAYTAVVSFTTTNEYLLTINDKNTSTNEYVPVYGWYADNYSLSQFIIPETQLEEIEWDTIQSMTFYASNESVEWGLAEFEVYMAEAQDATIGKFADWDALTQVKSGSLSISGNKMVVTLDEPYCYQGGNLLIGFKQTVSGDDQRCYWYGVSATGASYAGYKNSYGSITASQRNFLPKMTFKYVPGVAPACPNPKYLEVSDITASSATFSWKAVAGATWEYALVEQGAGLAIFHPTTENTLTIDNLEEGKTYVFYLRRACGEGSFSDETLSVEFTTLEFAQTLPYVEDFENAQGWKLFNDANAWMIGTAASDNGENALYISNDGASYDYDELTASVSYATKLFNFASAGTYTVQYDWKNVGDYDDESFEEVVPMDYMRAALVPADFVLTAGVQPEGLAYNNLPANWIALDTMALYAQEEWQHMSIVVPVPAAGNYRVVFAWINPADEYTFGVPAAIDNLSIVHKDWPTDIEGGAGIETKAIKFMKNNHVYILVNGVVYNITGQKVEVK